MLATRISFMNELANLAENPLSISCRAVAAKNYLSCERLHGKLKRSVHHVSTNLAWVIAHTCMNVLGLFNSLSSRPWMA